MEMIERVAQAIYEADDPWSEAFPWPNMGSAKQSADEYRRIAKTAIEAMREPTEAMIEAGDLPGWDDDVTVGLSAEVWLAMIDAALSPSLTPDNA